MNKTWGKVIEMWILKKKKKNKETFLEEFVIVLKSNLL